MKRNMKRNLKRTLKRKGEKIIMKNQDLLKNLVVTKKILVV